MPIQTKEPTEGSTTPSQWNLITRAAQTNTPEGRAARGDLQAKLRTLSTPAFRRYTPHDVEEGVQDFLACDDLVSGRFFARIRTERGFRKYVRGAARMHALGRRRCAAVRQRMEPARLFSDDGHEKDVVDQRTSPEMSYLKRRLLAAVYEKVRGDYERRGEGELFAELWRSLGENDHVERGLSVGKKPGAIKTQKSRFLDELEEEAHRLNDPRWKRLRCR